MEGPGREDSTCYHDRRFPMKDRILKRFHDEINALERELHVDLPKEILLQGLEGCLT